MFYISRRWPVLPSTPPRDWTPPTVPVLASTRSLKVTSYRTSTLARSSPHRRCPNQRKCQGAPRLVLLLRLPSPGRGRSQRKQTETPADHFKTRLVMEARYFSNFLSRKTEYLTPFLAGMTAKNPSKWSSNEKMFCISSVRAMYQHPGPELIQSPSVWDFKSFPENSKKVITHILYPFIWEYWSLVKT